MARANGSVPRRLSIAAALFLLGGCSVFQADRQAWTTLTLEPGQSLVGAFSGAESVHFASGRASTGHHGDLDLFFLSDPGIRIAFPESHKPTLQEEHELDYAVWDVAEEGPCTVVVRNAGTWPAKFHWIIHGSGNVKSSWRKPWSNVGRASCPGPVAE